MQVSTSRLHSRQGPVALRVLVKQSRHMRSTRVCAGLLEEALALSHRSASRACPGLGGKTAAVCLTGGAREEGKEAQPRQRPPRFCHQPQAAHSCQPDHGIAEEKRWDAQQPVFPPGCHCRYTTATSGRPCAAPLGASSAHALKCAYGPRMHRHDELHNQWATLLKEAGWHTRLEQHVILSSGTRRADVCATSPSGETVVLDVTCTTHPDFGQPIAAHLRATAATKAAQYGVAPSSRLPGGATMIPLVHAASVPFLGQDAVTFLLRITSASPPVRHSSTPILGAALYSSTATRRRPCSVPLPFGLHTACTSRAAILCSERPRVG